MLWNSTPRQLVARLHFSDRAQRRVEAGLISLHATAQRSDPKEVNKRLKELAKDLP